MVLEFYYDMWSPPCQAVYLLLKATGVPFEPIKVDMGKGRKGEIRFRG